MSGVQFKGKVAIVTGAGAGIGKAISREWVSCGGSVVVADKNLAAVRDLAGEIAADGGMCCAVHADVTDPAAVDNMAGLTVQEFGGVDVLFNVAGVNIHKNVAEMSYDEWQIVLRTNLDSVFLCSKRVIPEFRRRGGGAIVNMASTAGIMAENRCAAYSASKAAIIMLTRNMAIDFAADRIRVNALCPGGTTSQRVERYLEMHAPEKGAELMKPVPMKRLAKPEEVAKAAVFLASNENAGYITGSSLVVDGGMTAGISFAFFED